MPANVAHTKAPDVSLIQIAGGQQDPVPVNRLNIHIQSACVIYCRLDQVPLYYNVRKYEISVFMLSNLGYVPPCGTRNRHTQYESNHCV